jgi:hypothetical protein
MKLLKLLVLFTLTILTIQQHKIVIQRLSGQNEAVNQSCQYFTDGVSQPIHILKSYVEFHNLKLGEIHYDICKGILKEHTLKQKEIVQPGVDGLDLAKSVDKCITHRIKHGGEDVSVKILYLHALDLVYDVSFLQKVHTELGSYELLGERGKIDFDLRCITPEIVGKLDGSSNLPTLDYNQELDKVKQLAIVLKVYMIC